MNARHFSSEREAVVEQATHLAAALELANGDTPELAMAVRERLMAHLRSLSLVLWSDGLCE